MGAGEASERERPATLLHVPLLLRGFFACDVPLAEEEAVRGGEGVSRSQNGSRKYPLEGRHGGPFPIVSLEEDEGARSIKDLVVR